MTTTDIALQQQHIEGLYADHHGWLKVGLRRRLGDSFVAADLAQDTFLRLIDRRELPALKEPKAYLATVAHGLVVNHWRRQEIERACLEALASTAEAFAPSPETHAVDYVGLFTKILKGMALRRQTGPGSP